MDSPLVIAIPPIALAPITDMPSQMNLPSKVFGMISPLFLCIFTLIVKSHKIFRKSARFIYKRNVASQNVTILTNYNF